MDMERSAPLSQIDCLLILRVVATFAVVLGHSGAFFGGLAFSQWPNFPYIQNVAVTLFFCVSGFTIAWVVAQSDETGWGGFGRFTFNRFMRLSIPLVPILVIFGVIEAAALGSTHQYAANLNWQTAIGNFAFLQGLQLGIQPFGANRPLWTVAIEFWTYVAFGAAIYATRRGRTVWTLMLLAGAAILVIGVQAYGGRGSGLPLVWFAGAMLYHLLRMAGDLSRFRMVAMAAGIVPASLLFFPALWPEGGEYSYLYNGIIFASFGLFMVAVPGLPIHPRLLAVARFFSGFAYTTYLVHYPLMFLIFSSAILANGDATALGVSGLCLAVSWALSLPFEQRYKEIRNALWRRLQTMGRVQSA